jgi:hypothetical protein
MLLELLWTPGKDSFVAEVVQVTRPSSITVIEIAPLKLLFFRETTQFELYVITNVFFEIYPMNATLVGCPYDEKDISGGNSGDDDEADQPPRKVARGQCMVSFLLPHAVSVSFEPTATEFFYRFDGVMAIHLSDHSDRKFFLKGFYSLMY